MVDMDKVNAMIARENDPPPPVVTVPTHAHTAKEIRHYTFSDWFNVFVYAIPAQFVAMLLWGIVIGVVVGGGLLILMALGLSLF